MKKPPAPSKRPSRASTASRLKFRLPWLLLLSAFTLIVAQRVPLTVSRMCACAGPNKRATLKKTMTLQLTRPSHQPAPSCLLSSLPSWLRHLSPPKALFTDSFHPFPDIISHCSSIFFFYLSDAITTLTSARRSSNAYPRLLLLCRFRLRECVCRLR